jgi:hypothetical protein
VDDWLSFYHFPFDHYIVYPSKFNNAYKHDEIIQMLDFLVDNIFVKYHGLVFQQAMGIPMGANCEPLLADLFLHVQLVSTDNKILIHLFSIPLGEATLSQFFNSKFL